MKIKLSKIENQKVRLTLENFLAYQPYHLEIPPYTKKIFLESCLWWWNTRWHFWIVVLWFLALNDMDIIALFTDLNNCLFSLKMEEDDEIILVVYAKWLSGKVWKHVYKSTKPFSKTFNSRLALTCLNENKEERKELDNIWHYVFVIWYLHYANQHFFHAQP